MRAPFTPGNFALIFLRFRLWRSDSGPMPEFVFASTRRRCRALGAGLNHEGYNIINDDANILCIQFPWSFVPGELYVAAALVVIHSES